MMIDSLSRNWILTLLPMLIISNEALKYKSKVRRRNFEVRRQRDRERVRGAAVFNSQKNAALHHANIFDRNNRSAPRHDGEVKKSSKATSGGSVQRPSSTAKSSRKTTKKSDSKKKKKGRSKVKSKKATNGKAGVRSKSEKAPSLASLGPSPDPTASPSSGILSSIMPIFTPTEPPSAVSGPDAPTPPPGDVAFCETSADCPPGRFCFSGTCIRSGNPRFTLQWFGDGEFCSFCKEINRSWFAKSPKKHSPRALCPANPNSTYVYYIMLQMISIFM